MPITFLYPWVLVAASLLPILWWLLRVTPPAPRLIRFAPVRFLKDLIPDRTTPSKTPWWLLLLRCLLVLLVILALAGPVFNPSQTLPQANSIRIFIDNSWASAQTWDEQIRAASDILARASREKKSILLQTSVPEQGQKSVSIAEPIGYAEAISILRGLRPQPWTYSYSALANDIKINPPRETTHTYWFGHGLDEGGFSTLSSILQAQGSLDYIGPQDISLPVLLKFSKELSKDNQLQAVIGMPRNPAADVPLSLQALSKDGKILYYQSYQLKNKVNTLSMDIPDSIRNEVFQIQVTGRKSAGTTLLMDEGFKRRSVGIVTIEDKEDSKPLIDADYYLTRALEPYASLNRGSIDSLLDAEVSVMIVADIGSLPPATLDRLDTWVNDGGVLLRFAGPAMAASDPVLTPVPLVKGTRALEGDLTWEDPQALADFPESSPFYGLSSSAKIIVRQQLLAQPTPNMEDKIWAALEDGTPLITGTEKGKGLLILVHTTATPEWSDLALSGLYVDILRKIVTLSSGSRKLNQITQALQPLSIMDGYGGLNDPKGIDPIPANEFEKLVPSSLTPPGFYSAGGEAKAFNLGGRISDPMAIASFPAGIGKFTYAKEYEKNLMPLILSIAFGLLIIDWLIMIVMAAGWTLNNRTQVLSSLMAFIFIFAISPSHAASTDPQYAGEMYMAYIKTGNQSIDTTTENGLNALANVLTQRTSVEPKGTVALDPENDELSFFPFIYWAVSDVPLNLSKNALSKIQNYIDHGGTIIFDTRDQSYTISGAQGFGTTPNAKALQSMIGNLNIPSLTPAGKDHVLMKTFYLLDDFTGRYSGGPLWVAADSMQGRDGVSSIIIGGNDWASAWAAQSNGGGLRPHLSEGPHQQEMAMRFGINLMMYALTGNYKADQVHLPYILERLGQ